jgi:hypothetical protein
MVRMKMKTLCGGGLVREGEGRMGGTDKLLVKKGM